jgi:hypothetical protein
MFISRKTIAPAIRLAIGGRNPAAFSDQPGTKNSSRPCFSPKLIAAGDRRKGIARWGGTHPRDRFSAGSHGEINSSRPYR